MRRTQMGMVLVLGLLGACSDDEAPSGDGGTDSGTDGGMCAEASTAFEEFLAANGGCTVDAECAIIGDCGPNADFRAVRADAADEAYGLMATRCSAIYDGPTYMATCESGTCTARTDGMFCGMPSLPDGGVDGGVDGGADASSDAGTSGDGG